MKKVVVFITQLKATSERTGNQYDTTLKEIFEDSSEAFIQFFTGQNYKLEETMTIEFPKTENRRADGVFLISSTEGEMVCHIEFQSSNDSTIPYRMLRYALEIHQRKELPVCQILIYFGKKPITMKERLKYFVAPGQHLDFSYRTVDVGAMKHEEFLNLSNPKLYALLPVVDREYYQDKPEEHLQKSTEVILDSTLSLEEKRKVLFQANLLAGIVHEDSLVKKVFAEVDKMINLQESSTYRRIIREGQKDALTKTLIRQLNVKFGKLPESYVDRLEKQEYHALENIADKIFELDKPEDLDKYLN
ncbi:DUF4351 domain-containing protein [Heliorestis acidaminivorans]|uniref:DUF4351 domain-containing protein n=1 Tax=Heliorestis acidaminivorans TaxID=553427 RepID=A0A6I0EWX4_9FIRM|nr:DUF4351 domain-containing protein [Heliorestis acidaminivorans]KAB2950791.1 DUF4351 domain-containing protein [Heliorestis acidaminivorans]